MITMTCLIGVAVAASCDCCGVGCEAALAKGAPMANWNVARVASPSCKYCTAFDVNDVRFIFPPASLLARVAGFCRGTNSLQILSSPVRVLHESVPSFLRLRALRGGNGKESHQWCWD